MEKRIERTCSVCSTKEHKRELTRIAVFAAEMRLEIDPSGDLGGRGMYICRSRECVANFIKMVRKGKIRNMGKLPGRARERLIESLQKRKLWIE